MAHKPSFLSVTDLFCGAGGSSLGMHHASDEVEITLALNHWQLAIESHNANFPDTAHDCVDVSATDPRRYRSTNVLWASPECFAAGTLILATRGLVPIEDVRVGDKVLTHRNRWRTVTDVMARTGDSIRVSGQGNTPGVETTAEHPFYARSQSDEWREEGEKSVMRRTFKRPGWSPAATLCESTHRWATPVAAEPLPVPGVAERPMPLNDPEFWWLVGRWIGDGTVRLRDEHGHEITIACGNHKAAELERRLSYWEPTGKRAGVCELNWRRREVRTATLFETGHSGLAEWLVAHFGRLAHGKTIPAWSLGMPEEFRRALLAGYVSTDGHVSKRATQITTVSKSLAVGVRLLVESLGFRASLCRYAQHTNVIEGREVNTSDTWLVRWENNGSARTAFDDGHHAWSLVKSIQPGRPQVKLYNLEVEEDESYVADGIVVHNCTNHSLAKGKKRKHEAQLELFGAIIDDPAAERSRATMFDVPRFAEYHDYDVVIVENVVDVRHWRLYDAWTHAMDALGYDHKEVYFNSMFAHLDPATVRSMHDFAPQSRDRIYIVFWKRGHPSPDLDFRPLGRCDRCVRDVECVQAWKNGRRWGRYRQQYVYRCPQCAGEVVPYHFAAWNAIDWSRPAQRIGDRKKPLKERTMERIRRGLVKYGNTWLAVDLAYGDSHTARPMLAALPTQTSRQTLGMVTPQLVSVNDYDDRTMPVTSKPMGTQTTQTKFGLLMPQIITLRNHGEASAVTEAPTPTFAAGGNHVGLLMPTPMVMALGGRQNRDEARGAGEPLPTQTGTDSFGLVTPMPFLAVNYSPGYSKSVMEPAGAITAADHHSLVIPAPFLTSYYGTGGDASAAEQPMGTLTGTDKHALVMPFYVGYANGDGPPHAVTEPLLTLHTQNNAGLVFPAEPPAVEDCGFRMLKSHEVGRGMAFPDEYVVKGNERDRVKQFGNAVVPVVARMLMRRVLATFE